MRISTLRRVMPALCALVLDAQEVHSLAAIRSLGRRGVTVAGASPKNNPMGFASRHCHQRLRSPAAMDAPDAYADWLLETLHRHRYDAVLSFGEASAHVIATHRVAVQARTGCPFPKLETFLAADRKDRVTRLARSAGVPVPRTVEPKSVAELEDQLGSVELPAIVKAVHGSGGHQVVLARDQAQLVDAVRTLAANQAAGLPPPIVQEFIPGRGYGLTALARGGRPLAVFMHRRLAEHDVSRGAGLTHAAAGAECIEDSDLLAHGTALIDALQWDGMIMLEFRRSSRDGRFYLMEINPRFAGSLDLAIASGVDFPWLYLQHAAGLPLDPVPQPRIGLKYHWLVSKGIAPMVERPLGRSLDLLSVLRTDTRCDISFDDPKPHLSHARQALWWLKNRVRGSWARRRAVSSPAWRRGRPGKAA